MRFPLSKESVKRKEQEKTEQDKIETKPNHKKKDKKELKVG